MFLRVTVCHFIEVYIPEWERELEIVSFNDSSRSPVTNGLCNLTTCQSSPVIYNVNRRSAWWATLSSLRWAGNRLFFFFNIFHGVLLMLPAGNRVQSPELYLNFILVYDATLFTKVPRSIGLSCTLRHAWGSGQKSGVRCGESSLLFHTQKEK